MVKKQHKCLWTSQVCVQCVQLSVCFSSSCSNVRVILKLPGTELDCFMIGDNQNITVAPPSCRVGPRSPQPPDPFPSVETIDVALTNRLGTRKAQLSNWRASMFVLQDWKSLTNPHLEKLGVSLFKHQPPGRYLCVKSFSKHPQARQSAQYPPIAVCICPTLNRPFGIPPTWG